jgi:tetratricopeptide (TPR) repeat protein
MRARWLLLTWLLLAWVPSASAQQWFSVRTDHLISYSDGSDRGARDAALRGEQLIRVFEEIFHRNEITFAAPLRILVTHPASGPVLVRTPIANFVTVDPAQPDSWTQAAKSIGALILEDNYPRAQPWFDSGIVSYLAGVRFNGDQMELGKAPQGMVLPQADEWIPLAKLLENSGQAPLPAAQRAAFEAESWALVRWLIQEGRLAQAGAYLNAVQWRGAAPEQALIQAFSVSSSDLDHEVRESMRSLTTKTMPTPRVEIALINSRKVSAEDAHVLLANVSLFANTSGATNAAAAAEADRTLHELVVFMRQHQENAAVHRSLAWAYMLRGDMENAVEHIRRALALDDSDPSMHYLYARWVNQGEENGIRVESAETRMGSELKAALQRDPNYAAARELLGLAQLGNENPKPALENLQRASALRPRSSRYYLNLARAYEAAGKLDAARNLMLYASTGNDPVVSTEATELMSKLSREQKQREQWKAMGLQAGPGATHSKYDNLDEAIAEEDREDARSKAADTPADTRKVEFLKGRIVGVQCGAAPEAMLTVNSEGRIWKVHVADRNAAVLIGVQSFDCGWHGETVTINYKPSGRLQGDMVSLEID